MKKRLKVTITRVRRPVGQQEQLLSGPCPECLCEVALLTPLQAAEALEVSLPTLASMVSAGRVHGVETVSGSVRICRDSLFISYQSARALP